MKGRLIMTNNTFQSIKRIVINVILYSVVGAVFLFFELFGWLFYVILGFILIFYMFS